MGEQHTDWRSVKQRLADKWQIPLFVCSLIALTATMFALHTSVEDVSPEQSLATLDALIASESYPEAVDFARKLLDVPDRTPDLRGRLSLRLARATFGRAIAERDHTARSGRAIEKAYAQAELDGNTLSAADLRSRGFANEWLGQHATAVELYDRACAEGIDDAIDIERRSLGLREQYLREPAPELIPRFERFLASLPDDRLDLRIWTIERLIASLDRTGRIVTAANLLDRQRSFFADSDFVDRFDYFEAFVLASTGREDEAELRLRALRDRVPTDMPEYAMSGWLLGRIVLYDDGPERPMEAISFFGDVIEKHRHGPYSIASHLGRAEALAMLERHEEALNDYQIVLESLAHVADSSLVDAPSLRTALIVQADVQRKKGKLEPALGYARLATHLVNEEAPESASLVYEQLGEIEELQADRLFAEGEESLDPDTVAQAKKMYARASETFLVLARMVAMQDAKLEQASWRAAELARRAGLGPRAIELLSSFVAEHPRSSLVPRALRMIGELYLARGGVDEAIMHFQQCFRQFPRTLDGARSLIPLARAYFANGDDVMAELTLQIVLDDPDVFTPEAPEYADALFLRGEVQERRGAFEDAIGTLEEALERFPDDPRVLRAGFTLAEAYRQSALALREESRKTRFATKIQEMRHRARTRLATAKELYRRLLDEYEILAADKLSPEQRVLRRLAHFYEADCYFENQEYASALGLYEEATATFRDTESALAAYVQMVNCHVFLGQRAEAKAALARALVQVDSIPNEQFARSISPETREDWRRYFTWLRDSSLL